MVTISQPLMNDLVTYYMYANTLPYVYSRYRQLPGLACIAEQHSLSEIADTINDRLENLASIKDLVTIYGLIVALSFRPYVEVAGILSELGVQSVEWIGELAAYTAGMARTTVSVEVTPVAAQPQPVVAPSPGSTDNSYEITPQAKLESIHV